MNLQDYRREARRITVLRDGGLCMMCKWVHNERTKYAHVHHVFGRGALIGSVKEIVSSLMCVCPDCHPQPILIYTEHSWKGNVLHTWQKMNMYPEGSDYLLSHGMEILNPVGLPVFKIGIDYPTDWSMQE